MTTEELLALGLSPKEAEQYQRPVPWWRNPLFGAHLRSGHAFWNGHTDTYRPCHPYAHRTRWHGHRPRRPR